MLTEQGICQMFKKEFDVFDKITTSKTLNNSCIIYLSNSEENINFERIINLDADNEDLKKVIENIKLLLKYR